MSSEPSGYTLPVWVCAAARAAAQCLAGEGFVPEQSLQLEPGRSERTSVPVLAAAPLDEGWVLAMARCDPGPGVLDLTRDLLVWTLLRRVPLSTGPSWLRLEAGEGVGIHAASRELCVSSYARALLEANLRPLVPEDCGLQLRIVLPAGRTLAQRTSNAAFGVVDGLALIGTQAAVQRSAAPEQLQQALADLRHRAAVPGFGGDLVLVIGENGLDLAPRLGLSAALLIKAGNWIGPVLVAAAEVGVRRLLLFGYQGKLIKLAGGIFHTHHHLADGRAEVLTAFAALEGLAGPALASLHAAATVDGALAELQAVDGDRAERVRGRIAQAVEQRSMAYLARYGHASPQVGAVLFDRERHLCAQGPMGSQLWADLCGRVEDASRGDS